MIEEFKTVNNVNYVRFEDGEFIEITNRQKKILEEIKNVNDYSGFDSIMENWFYENNIDVKSEEATEKSLLNLIDLFYNEITSFSKIINEENDDFSRIIRKSLTETVLQLEKI